MSLRRDRKDKDQGQRDASGRKSIFLVRPLSPACLIIIIVRLFQTVVHRCQKHTKILKITENKITTQQFLIPLLTYFVFVFAICQHRLFPVFCISWQQIYCARRQLENVDHTRMIT